MRPSKLLLAVLSLLVAGVVSARAHGDQPHPKCKKGYVVSDEHKCVKA